MWRRDAPECFAKCLSALLGEQRPTICFGKKCNHMHREVTFPFRLCLVQAKDKACWMHCGIRFPRTVDSAAFLTSVLFRSVKVCFQSEPMIPVLDAVHPLCEWTLISAFVVSLSVQLCNEFRVSFSDSFFLHSGAWVAQGACTQKTAKDCWYESKVTFAFLSKYNKIYLYYNKLYLPQTVRFGVNKFCFINALILSRCPQFALNYSGI